MENYATVLAPVVRIRRTRSKRRVCEKKICEVQSEEGNALLFGSPHCVAHFYYRYNTSGTIALVNQVLARDYLCYTWGTWYQVVVNRVCIQECAGRQSEPGK